MSTIGGSAAAPPLSTTVPRSPWHSPVPYLFGGLAAMLGLIAFALLILACSYWKLSGYLENDADRDLEAGEADGEKAAAKLAPPVMEEKFLVIMAGQLKPTFLATPMSSRASSFGSKSSCCSTSCTESSTVLSEEDFEEKKKIENGGETGNAGPEEDQLH